MEQIAALERAVRNIPDFPKPGIQFKDITPILADPQLLHGAVEVLAAPFRDQGVTKVMGIEARGFILGCLLAHQLGAGFVPVRKRGKLPHEVLTVAYELEYGTDTIEMHADALTSDDRVLIHDDVIATGGTASASYRLAEQTGAQVVGYSFLVELAFLEGRRLLAAGVPVHAALTF